ncbi:ribonuclease R [Oribacterium sp. WCC10]|uniref:ribonuclease R n=1 Tax=Oribacterium sp. WCC10 TaxID=1855343 RepID=UPI0008E42869|nr:ribonuclease R [Oribacterium sp. WCC10]SFG29379.1 ribonuclease R [Oribacterium sp. WCC10]
MEDYQKDKLARLIVDLVKDKIYQPMKAKEMANLIGIPKAERAALQEVLDRLVSEGKIGISQKGKYGRTENFTHVGTFTANQRGFGFVSLEGHEDEDDIFIPADYIGQALDGDKVRIIITKNADSDHRSEGHITQILEHANKEIVGIYRKNKSVGFVEPDNQRILKDIFIPQGRDMRAVNGHKVVVKILNYGDEKHKPEGVIKEILGHINDPGVDILSIVRAYGLPETFPKDIMKAAESVPDTVPENEVALRKDHDFRDLTTVTIDGEDAKDLDDAISLQYDEKNEMYKLYVHIADVTQYVTEHSLIDQEALNRGTSVYLTDRVIPMLPRVLCNGICSLNEGEDRLTLTCIMDIDKNGKIVDHEICESVIHSNKRMTYNGVHSILTGEELKNGEDIESYLPYKDLLLRMYELSKLLRKRRHERGGIDFDFPETRILLDEKGKVTEILPYIRNEAHMLIEDFMLAANETVAEDFFWQQVPFVYRVHEKPDPEKFMALGMAVSNFGHFIRMRDEESIRPKEVQKLLESIEGSPEEPIIKTMTLRSLKQARYSTECSGHFGLAAKYYCHFTSPIRRYPDLQIHRIIKEDLRGELKNKRLEHYKKLLPVVADRSSTLERRADEAERETDKLKECEWMQHHLNEEFDGVVSGLTNYGIYVELPNTVEGMVSLRFIDSDYFVFHEDKYELVGERTGKVYRLGDRVRVRAIGADKLTRTIDFQLLKNEE